jgi:hypothetical protein
MTIELLVEVEIGLVGLIRCRVRRARPKLVVRRRTRWTAGENINDDDWFYRFSFLGEKLNESSEQLEKFTAYATFILHSVFTPKKRKTYRVRR